MKIKHKFFAAFAAVLLITLPARSQGSGPDVAANIPAGKQFTITVTATSLDSTGRPAPMTVQWLFNGSPIPLSTIPSAQSPALVIPSAPEAASGVYTASLQNAGGTTISPKATVTMISLAAITTQPVAQGVMIGSTATFSVVATSAGPTSYQWKKDGSLIAGATAATFSIATVTASSVGNYSVMVTNLAGSVTSVSAGLTVITISAPVVTGFGITSP